VTALVATVFVASLTGSLHCAGMCGAFVMFSVGAERRGSWLRQAAYHGGRLLTYALLGAAAGWVGSAIDVGSAAFGVRRGAMILAGVAMIGFGVVSLLRAFGVRIGSVRVPEPLGRWYRRGYAAAQSLPGAARAFVIGLLSTLLPCGWLYAFVVTAAGTGSVAAGALTMAVFWVGTLPVLAAVGFGVQRLAGPLGRRLPALAAVAIIVVGLAALLGRLQIPDPSTPGAPTHHHGALRPAADTPAIAVLAALREPARVDPRPPAATETRP